MEVVRRAGLALALTLLAFGQAQGAQPVTATSFQATLPATLTAVQADADLSAAAPVQLAERKFKPSYLDRPCSFVPAKNPVRQKRNACRFV